MVTKQLSVLLTSLLLLAACRAPVSSRSPVALTPTSPLVTAETTENPVESASIGAAACPQPTEGTALYVSRENGFCFLYPSDLTLRPDSRFPQDAVQLTGAPLDPEAMESFALSLAVLYNGPADGLDSAQYAAAWVERNSAGMSLPETIIGGGSLEQSDAVIGGQPAVVIANLPGMISRRGAFVVANEAKYQITLQPQPQDVPDLADAATNAWDTITQSFVFFPPGRTDSIVRSADVCPAATADTKLLINEVGGYCLLYPADFELDPTVPYDAIVGGPELGPLGDFPSVRVSLGIGGAYPLSDRTPEQVLQQGSENIDPDSVANTTIGGYPAVTSDFIAGPWRQRNATIVVQDSYYTFASGPWDPERFPQALPDVERLWNTVSQSIAFFDPWR